MAKPPKQKPGRSQQVVCTPKEFLVAVRNRLQIDNFAWDLAASHENKICDSCWTEEDDALVQNWNIVSGWSYCNPPFSDLEPWVAKASLESLKGAQIVMLLPASVGSRWFREFVHDKAHVIFLSPRLTFEGHTNCYPKDLILTLWAKFITGGYSCWNWKDCLRPGK